MTRIVDNTNFGMLDVLQEHLPYSTSLDCCVGYFSMRSWGQVHSALHQLNTGVFASGAAPQVRLLIGMAAHPMPALRDELNPLFEAEPIPDFPRANLLARETIREYARQLTWGLHSGQEQKSLRLLLEDLRSGFLKIHFYTRRPLHAKLYVLHLQGGAGNLKAATVGSSNFTPSGLGRNGELNIEETDNQTTLALSQQFNEWWDDAFTIDVSADLVQALEECWALEPQPTPRQVHLKLAYELSKDARDGRNVEIPSKIAAKLTKWQDSAVRIATRIVKQRGLAIIGDVVGLGKTLTGTAIAGSSGESVLMICPKNLQTMWEKHFEHYDIPGRVVPLSMVTRTLPELRAYKLVMIDESHNLRNAETKAWDAIRDYVSNSSANLVLLTATLFNKDHSDIADQLKLKLDSDFEVGFRPEDYIEHLGEFGEQKLAEQVNGKLTSLAAFELSQEPGDWQRLLGLFLVRRTRKYLTETYGKVDPESGHTYFEFNDGTRFHFPERKVEPLRYKGGPNDPGDRLVSEGVIDVLQSLNYARYQPAAYLNENSALASIDKSSELGILLSDIKRGRASVGFIRTTVLKRLASSPFAFFVTLEKMLVRGQILLYALENQRPLPLGTLDDKAYQSESDLNDDGNEAEWEEREGSSAVPATWARGYSQEQWQELASTKYETLQSNSPRGLRWGPVDWFDSERFADELRGDLEKLQELVDEHGEWDPEHDTKIQALADLVKSLGPDEKLLVFSEYKDTVDYIHRHLVPLAPSVRIDAVSGSSSSDPTHYARRFSPLSNADIGGLPAGEQEIQVLLATDVLSEGQNLQDSAIVLNWDLPWTIIKLIQRAGRVDRVGQRSTVIRVLSFLPHEGVDERIRLMKVLAGRLKTNQEILGGAERFFDIDSDLGDIGGIFDGGNALIPDEGDVDFGSLALSIWDGATETERMAALRLSTGTASSKRATIGDPSLVVYAKALGSDETQIDFLASSNTQGEARLITPLEALQRTACGSDAETILLSDDHRDNVMHAVRSVVVDQAKKPLILAHFGLRKRLYDFLVEVRDDVQTDNDQRALIEEITSTLMRFPLFNAAQDNIREALRLRHKRGNPYSLEVISGLYRENELIDTTERQQTELEVTLSMEFAI